MGDCKKHPSKRCNSYVSQKKMEDADVSRCKRSVLGRPPTQVSPEDFASGKVADGIHHKLLPFFSTLFNEAQLQWLMVGKESYAIVSDFKRGR